jgi:hypothetical protein
MVSTKKSTCIKCDVLLTLENWTIYDQKKSYYICATCRKSNDKKCHQINEYAKKQKGRYRMRRSAVILAYGNLCAICNEDDYTKLTINGDINFLYNNIIQKDGHKVLCYNCSKNKSNTSQYKKKIVEMNGGCCQLCQEDRVNKLMLNTNKQLLCYNCHYSQIAIAKYDPEDLELLG